MIGHRRDAWPIWESTRRLSDTAEGGGQGPARRVAGALAAAEQELWNGPLALWVYAGGPVADCGPDCGPGCSASDRWRRESGYQWTAGVVELLAGPTPQGIPCPGFRRAEGSGYAASIARTIAQLPELAAAELQRRGQERPDARRSATRRAARELGWRPATLRAFTERRVPFNWFTAAQVAGWLAATATHG